MERRCRVAISVKKANAVGLEDMAAKAAKRDALLEQLVSALGGDDEDDD